MSGYFTNWWLARATGASRWGQVFRFGSPAQFMINTLGQSAVLTIGEARSGLSPFFQWHPFQFKFIIPIYLSARAQYLMRTKPRKLKDNETKNHQTSDFDNKTHHLLKSPRNLEKRAPGWLGYCKPICSFRFLINALAPLISDTYEGFGVSWSSIPPGVPPLRPGEWW